MTTTAVTTTKPKDIISLLDRQKGELTKALGSQIPADFFVRVALTAMRKNPLLYRCTQDSLMQCMMDLAQIRLVPDSITGEAYLIPFRNGPNYECQLMIGYQGYLKMMRRSATVTNVYAATVCANDEFDISFGSNRRMVHKPRIGGDRGKMIGAVAYVSYKKNEEDGEDFVWVDSDYIERVKKSARGASSASSPWVQWPEAMWAKTALKQLAKTADLSPDVREAVSRAAEIEGAIDIPASVETPEPSESEIVKEQSTSQQPSPAPKKRARRQQQAEEPDPNDAPPGAEPPSSNPSPDGGSDELFPEE